jgi:hypothetical protein
MTRIEDPDPNLDPFVRGMDPRTQIRIRIHSKMSWIRNTRCDPQNPALSKKKYLYFLLILWVIFALLVLHPATQNNAIKANPNSNPKPWQYQSYFLLQLRETN